MAECPSGKALEKVIDLPKGWSLPQSGVRCLQNWATANPKRTAPGDGVHMFHYTAGKGWRYHGEGSDFSCKDLGITGPAPVCNVD